MKIIMIIDHLKAGGKERRFVELLKGFSVDETIQCEIVILSDVVQYPDLLKLPYKIHYLIRKSKKDPRVLVKLYKICKIFKPQIIHSWESMTSIYALPVAKLLRIKLIHSITNAPPRIGVLSQTWVRSKILFPLSTAIVSNSQAGLYAYGVPWKKSYCIPNGFDFNRIENLNQKDQIRDKFGIKTNKVVGMVGTFTKRKDYKTYLEAAMLVLGKNEDVVFLAVGDGALLEESKRMVSDQYRDKIIFTGLQDNVESLVNIFDIGILLSNKQVHGEGISNAIVEYMVLGKPVIATNSGGTKELVVDNVTGMLVNQEFLDQLVNKIEYLLSHPDRAAEMGKAGKQRIIEQFSLGKMTKEYNSLYQEVLKK